MPGRRARLRPRRLHRRVPRGRSRPEHRADRAPCDTRRRLPQRRLHSVEGAAACGARDRRGRARERHRNQLRQAEDRPRQVAREQGQGRRATDRWPRQHGETAQGHGRAGHRPFHLAARDRSRRQGRQEARAFRQRDHRGRFAGVQTAGLPVGRPAHDGFDRCAEPRRHPEEIAGRRRRHHRPGNGLRV